MLSDDLLARATEWLSRIDISPRVTGTGNEEENWSLIEDLDKGPKISIEKEGFFYVLAYEYQHGHYISNGPDDYYFVHDPRRVEYQMEDSALMALIENSSETFTVWDFPDWFEENLKERAAGTYMDLVDPQAFVDRVQKNRWLPEGDASELLSVESVAELFDAYIEDYPAISQSATNERNAREALERKDEFLTPCYVLAKMAEIHQGKEGFYPILNNRVFRIARAIQALPDEPLERESYPGFSHSSKEAIFKEAMSSLSAEQMNALIDDEEALTEFMIGEYGKDVPFKTLPSNAKSVGYNFAGEYIFVGDKEMIHCPWLLGQDTGKQVIQMLATIYASKAQDLPQALLYLEKAVQCKAQSENWGENTEGPAGLLKRVLAVAEKPGTTEAFLELIINTLSNVGARGIDWKQQEVSFAPGKVKKKKGWLKKALNRFKKKRFKP